MSYWEYIWRLAEIRRYQDNLVSKIILYVQPLGQYFSLGKKYKLNN